MISVEHAVNIAVDYCRRLFEQTGEIRLEEVELGSDDKLWFITVGFELPKAPPGTLYGAIAQLQGTSGRQYKVVSLDAETGVVRSVKIRQPLERIS